jgi:hypothetical protein
MQPAPKPDRMSGEPRPPQAPVESSWMPYDKAKDLGPENPPPDNGPALEWFADAKSTMWGSAVFALVILLAFLTLRWGGLGWMQVWWLWLIVLAGASLFLFMRKSLRMTAGADWLLMHGVCLNTYRLRKIRVTTGVGTYHLVLIDTEGETIDTQVHYLQKNRKLWDLVYNGILHSIVYNGADVNRRAVEHLQLQAVIRKPPIDR